MDSGEDGRYDRSDAELLADHVGGDREAFAELVRRHHGRLHRLARRCSRSPEDAADALQDALLAVHRAAGSFRSDAAVSSWLYRIVVNACRDRLRNTCAHETRPLEDTAVVADRTAQVATAITVHRALRRLPTDQRAAVIAVHLQDRSVAETARALGVAEGTVKSRCARARVRLAALLTDPVGPARTVGGNSRD
ncbi:RNA polymerase sigma factor SigM [Mycobacterium sp. 1274756.6]|uniref:RNA polymerase sigma factor SigM n=1 Tax=Mycobacterium sp. 1274756.6 TaxID=1834076 RepID=UPI0007FEC0C0|nr:RNA polymerase sigma factor SigM [Mycobacterium sp. 1274756.6]OBJ68142.1 RNA polymerase sigma factor SigM [Mycobacterium sp. 1274756.6]